LTLVGECTILRESGIIWVMRIVTNTILATIILSIFSIDTMPFPLSFVGFAVLLGVSYMGVSFIFYVFSYIPIKTDHIPEIAKYIGIFILGCIYHGLVLLHLISQAPGLLFAIPIFELIVIWTILSAIQFIGFPYLTEEFAEVVDDSLERFLTSLPVVMIIWMCLGAWSGLLILEALTETLEMMGFGEFQDSGQLLSSAIIFGASLAVISVSGRKERLTIINPKISAYVHVMRKLAITDSLFISSIRKKGEPTYLRFDHIKAQNSMEKLVPWALLTISLTWYRIVKVPFIEIGELIFTGVFAFGAIAIIIGIFRQIYWYRRWRRVWSDWWNLLGLLSLSTDYLAIEYLYHLDHSDNLVLLDNVKDMKDELKDQIDRFSLKFDDTTTDDEIKRFYVNIELYELSKRKIERPKRQITEADKQTGIFSKASKMFSEINLDEVINSRDSLVRILLYANVHDEFDLPISMYEDISYLFKDETIERTELVEFSNEQLKLLEETPSIAVPSSVKWLPVIYSFAVWFTTSVVSLF